MSLIPAFEIGVWNVWLFLLITVTTFFLQRFQMMQEEGYCREKFGDAYREYMNRTPGWIGIPKRSNQK